MKIVVIEPLAVEEKRFLEIARAAVGQEPEIVCYDTRMSKSLANEVKTRISLPWAICRFRGRCWNSART